MLLGHTSWVREHREKILDYAGWDRRAIIYAAQILSNDEKSKWLKRLKQNPTVPQLERWLIDWVVDGTPEVAPLPNVPPKPMPDSNDDLSFSDFEDDIPF